MQYEGIRKTSNETVEHVEPGRCMPAFVKDPIEFLAAADSYERANAKAYIEYEIPYRMNSRQNSVKRS